MSQTNLWKCRFTGRLAAFVVLAFMAGMYGTAYGQLQWDTKELLLHSSPADSESLGHFKFRNAGAVAIEIASVSTSCACTTATSTKINIAPGEAGEITVTFKIGERVGLQQKAIVVKSSDPETPIAILTLKVDILEVARVKPTVLFWEIGESAAPKEIQVEIPDGLPNGIITVEPGDPRILVRVEQTKPGREYRLIVEPKQADTSFGTVLKIKVELPQGIQKTFQAHVRIK